MEHLKLLINQYTKFNYSIEQIFENISELNLKERQNILQMAIEKNNIELANRIGKAIDIFQLDQVKDLVLSIKNKNTTNFLTQLVDDEIVAIIRTIETLPAEEFPIINEKSKQKELIDLLEKFMHRDESFISADKKAKKPVKYICL